jgi:hypothetical protein
MVSRDVIFHEKVAWIWEGKPSSSHGGDVVAAEPEEPETDGDKLMQMNVIFHSVGF